MHGAANLFRCSVQARSNSIQCCSSAAGLAERLELAAEPLALLLVLLEQGLESREQAPLMRGRPAGALQLIDQLLLSRDVVVAECNKPFDLDELGVEPLALHGGTTTAITPPKDAGPAFRKLGSCLEPNGHRRTM